MKFRANYFIQVNSPQLPVYNNSKKMKPVQKKNILNRIKDKILFKYEILQKQRANKKYYEQFDKISELNEQVDILFVATSAFKNKQNYSIELQDLVKQTRALNKKVAFVLPDYDTSILRSPDYDYFYSLELRKKISFSPEEMKTIDDFKKFLCTSINFLYEKDVADLNSLFSSVIAQSLQLKEIIKQTKCSLVTARSLYSDKWVTMAVAGTRAKSLEVQHGTFTKNNFYYHSLSNLTHSQLLLPEFIACLGDEWIKILRSQSSHWTNENSGLVGTSLGFKRMQTKNEKINVLIAFQDFSVNLWEIRPEIFPFLEKHAVALDEFNFILRVHPADKLSDLEVPHGIKNVILSDPRLEPTSEALSKCSILICATSMMIYEAVNFQIPVISLERFRKMTQEPGVYFIQSLDDLFDCLKNKKYKTEERIEYLNKPDFSFYNSLVLSQK